MLPGAFQEDPEITFNVHLSTALAVPLYVFVVGFIVLCQQYYLAAPQECPRNFLAISRYSSWNTKE